MRIKSGKVRMLCLSGLFIISTGVNLGANALNHRGETAVAIAVLFTGVAIFLFAFYLLFRWRIL